MKILIAIAINVIIATPGNSQVCLMSQYIVIDLIFHPYLILIKSWLIHVPSGIICIALALFVFWYLMVDLGGGGEGGE